MNDVFSFSNFNTVKGCLLNDLYEIYEIPEPVQLGQTPSFNENPFFGDDDYDDEIHSDIDSDISVNDNLKKPVNNNNPFLGFRIVNQSVFKRQLFCDPPQPPDVCYNEEIFGIFVKLFFDYFPSTKNVYFDEVKNRFYFKVPKNKHKIVSFSKKDFIFEDFKNFLNGCFLNKTRASRVIIPREFFNFENFYQFLLRVYFKKFKCTFLKRYMRQVVPKMGTNLKEDDIYKKLRRFRVKASKKNEVVYVLNLYYNYRKDFSVLLNLKKFNMLSYISYDFIETKSGIPQIKWKLNKNIDGDFLKKNIVFVFLKRNKK